MPRGEGGLTAKELDRIRAAGETLVEQYDRYRKAGVITPQEWALAEMYLTVATSGTSTGPSRLSAITHLARFEGMFLGRAKEEMAATTDMTMKQLFFETFKAAGIKEFQVETFEAYLKRESRERKESFSDQKTAGISGVFEGAEFAP